MKKTNFQLIIFFTLLLTPVFLVAQQNSGNLLIVAEPGLRVYVDNEFKGFTSDEQDGIFLENIKSGSRKITLKMSGTEDKIFDIDISNGKTAEIDLNNTKFTRNNTKTQISEKSQLDKVSITKIGKVIIPYNEKYGYLIALNYSEILKFLRNDGFYLSDPLFTTQKVLYNSLAGTIPLAKLKEVRLALYFTDLVTSESKGEYFMVGFLVDEKSKYFEKKMDEIRDKCTKEVQTRKNKAENWKNQGGDVFGNYRVQTYTHNADRSDEKNITFYFTVNTSYYETIYEIRASMGKFSRDYFTTPKGEIFTSFKGPDGSSSSFPNVNFTFYKFTD